MSFFKKIFGRDPQPEPDWIGLNGSDFTFEGEPDGTRIWRLPDGDAVAIFFFDMPPDLPSGAPDATEFVTAYRSLMVTNGAEVVEADLVTEHGLAMLRSIVKLPQPTTGMAYLGSYTIPFRHFSYVVKVQCSEQSPTGLREAALLTRALAAGEVTVDEDRITGDWNPDAEEHDDVFPEHPVSRARRNLGRIRTALVVDQQLRSSARFELPT